MIRVLNIVFGLNNAGTEAFIMNYYRHIDRTKVQFDFLVTDMSKGYYADEIEALGGTIYRIPGFLHHPFKNVRLRRAILKKYDIVELHAMHVWRFGYCKDAKRCGVQHMIFHVHSAEVERGLLISYARKAIVKYCDEIVACAQSAAENMLGRRADRVVLNAIDPALYAFDPAKRAEIRAHYGLPDTARVLGHVGRFAEQKNHAFLVESFALAAKKREDVFLLLKGFGPLREEIKTKICEMGLEKRVLFADGYEARELYSAFDLFVLPSLYEGLPVVTVEAQANGLPMLLADAITRECDIGGDVTFLPPEKEVWAEEMLKERPRKAIADFAATGYDINAAAAERQEEYLRMAGV